VDRIGAAVICAANAVHMTAPAEDHHASKKPLQQGSHPHMMKRRASGMRDDNAAPSALWRPNSRDRPPWPTRSAATRWTRSLSGAPVSNFRPAIRPLPLRACSEWHRHRQANDAGRHLRNASSRKGGTSVSADGGHKWRKVDRLSTRAARLSASLSFRWHRLPRD